ALSPLSRAQPPEPLWCCLSRTVPADDPGAAVPVRSGPQRSAFFHCGFLLRPPQNTPIASFSRLATGKYAAALHSREARKFLKRSRAFVVRNRRAAVRRGAR